MANEIWGSSVGLVLAALKQKSREMKNLERDMIAMDKPGFTRTIQESAIYYAGDQAIGITEGDLQEVTDINAENQLRSIAAQAEKMTSLEKYISEYQNAFGQMGGSNAFIASGNKVVTAINTLCSQGGDNPANKKAVIEAIKYHTLQINSLADKLQSLRDSVSKEVTSQFPKINELLKDIATINANMEAPGATSASNISYKQQRRAKLEALSEYLEIRVEDTNSDFLVYTPKGRVLVQKDIYSEFIYTPPPQIDASQTFGAGTITLQSISVDVTNAEAGVVPPALGRNNYYYRREEAFVFDVSNDFSNAQGGSISGAMQFLQNDSLLFAQELDAYAAGLRDSFNEIHNLSSAIKPRATLQGSSGYIGGANVVGTLGTTAAGTLRIAVIDATTNLATVSTDIDISGVTTINNTADNTSLCYLINNNATLLGHVTASIVNGSLQITTTDANCGISLGSVSGAAVPTINGFGFSEFFHLNDVITAPASFWRGGSITGLASNITFNSDMLSNPEYFSVNKLRDNSVPLGAAQAVSGDPLIGRLLSDLFTRTKTVFATPTGGTISQTLEDFSAGLVKEVANKVSELQSDKEAQNEAYRQQKELFSQQYGMNEQDIAILSMEISKSQDLYFSFMNNYWRMMSRIAEMGK
jgi:flagellar hook-associated protein FlgK